MALIIRKKIELDFLGEEYKDAFLVFRSVPLKDYESIVDKTPKQQDEKASLQLIIDTLQKYFLEGKFPDEKNELQPVTKDDIVELDANTAIRCFQLLTGGELSPKVPEP